MSNQELPNKSNPSMNSQGQWTQRVLNEETGTYDEVILTDVEVAEETSHFFDEQIANAQGKK